MELGKWSSRAQLSQLDRLKRGGSRVESHDEVVLVAIDDILLFTSNKEHHQNQSEAIFLRNFDQVVNTNTGTQSFLLVNSSLVCEQREGGRMR